MKVKIFTKNIENDSQLREFAARKVAFGFDRIENRIEDLTLRICDESPGSNSFHGSCEIDINLRKQGHIRVTATGESPFDAVLQCVRKAESAAKHDIDRHRKTARIRHQTARLRSKSSAWKYIVWHDSKDQDKKSGH